MGDVSLRRAAARPVGGPPGQDSDPSAPRGILRSAQDAARTTGVQVDPDIGLREHDVLERVRDGQVNGKPPTTGRTAAQILRANVLTRFNAILGSLFIVVVVVGPVQDALFGIVLVVNTAIGIAQEVRSKRTLDQLAILTAPTSHVVRDGAVAEVPFEEIVLDDVVALGRGDQLPVDGVVLSADGLELDESLLTGEAEPVAKDEGDGVLSGSFVVAGSGRIRASGVGAASYASGLEAEARRFSLIRSELQQGTNEILRIVTWVMVPTGVALFTTQLLRSHQSSTDALRASVAGVAAMVPEGLVLLTSMAFAAGALRLARRRVLVQELAAVEGLARVDVVCIDKTGTLTEPGLELADVEPVGATGRPDVVEVLGHLARADPAPNATSLALRALLPDGAEEWPVRAQVAFSSARKWSAVTFTERGSWLLGAPQIVLPGSSPDLRARVSRHEQQAQRVLVLCRSAEPVEVPALPPSLEPVALVTFAERLRQDAAPTVEYLLDQGVRVKVVSGDAPGTVTEVARRLRLPIEGGAIDVSSLEDEVLVDAVDHHDLLCRVRPDQKRTIVSALQSQGHVVAMVGDGVNDVPALKQADLGMAMGSGSQSSRSVARVVLLDSDFAAVPRIVAEGRRVIANIERVANLFVTKTVYATLLAVTVVVLSVPYPFFPRHLTIVSTLTIGVPGFFLAFGRHAPRANAGFTRRVARFTIPAGCMAAAATAASYLIVRAWPGTTVTQSRTAALLAVFGVGWWVLVLVARPLNRARVLLVLVMLAAFIALFSVSLARNIFTLALPPTAAVLVVCGVVLVSIVSLSAWFRRWDAGAYGRARRPRVAAVDPGSAPASVEGGDR
jgi:cation-transporting P-type ATPase E